MIPYKNTQLKLILLCFFAMQVLCVNAQDIKSNASIEKTIKKSHWKGFSRLDFKLNKNEVRLVKPNKPLLGNPWIWRARFPDWHTKADSILVAEGFHLVYVNTNNQFGSPKAVSIWNSVYKHVTKKYKLNKKVALMGVSRGGLYVYNWAKKNPKKVSCIYAEAPVCDFKSWPAGYGKFRGNEENWNHLKKEYGFNSDEEAKAYTNNPIDNLQSLANEKVPILHTIGLHDKIVPPEENTQVLINRYIKLGGSATVVPCTKGKQNLEGHHFEIETPRLVADFIKYHSLKNAPLNPALFHKFRSGLENSKIKFERTKKGRVAFVGGSITEGGGWRDSICNYLTKRFPNTKFEFIPAGIGSMGSTPAAFRLQRDVLSKGNIDLLFEEAAVNDFYNKRTAKEQVRAMEGIIRHLRNSNPTIDIVMMHFVDPPKMATYRQGKEPKVITNHNKVAVHYNIPTINLAKEITERIDHGEFNWKDDFKNLHPSPFGQGIYARSMLQFLDNAYAGYVAEDDKIATHPMPNKLDPLCYDNGSLIEASTLKPSKGWKINPSWKPNDGTGTRQNYVNVPMLLSQTPNKILKIKFRGNTVGIAIAAGQDAGMISYRIDKGEWQQKDLFTQWSKSLHLPWYLTLATGLSNKEHKLEIRIDNDKNSQSSGNACRIRYLYVNQ